MTKLREDQVTMAGEMVARGEPVRRMAAQLGVDESTLRYRVGRASDAPDGRRDRPSALDGWVGELTYAAGGWPGARSAAMPAPAGRFPSRKTSRTPRSVGIAARGDPGAVHGTV